MNKKEIKEAFQKDIESCSMLNNNLSFEQIRDKIEIKDRRRQEENYKKYFPNWRLISSIVGIVLVFSMSLLYFNLSKTSKYKESPFAEQLDGKVFGSRTNESLQKNLTISNYIDLQNNENNTMYFYEVEMNKLDDYYTCGYFPSSAYEEISSLAEIKHNIYDYTKNLNIIDGKLLASYLELIDENIKWYQISKDEEIPETIEEYQLGLVLGSRDIYFYENKTRNEALNITRKIFVREFYDLNTKKIDNQFNRDEFFLDIENKYLLISMMIINLEDTIYNAPFEYGYNINNNELSLRNTICYNEIGHYKEQLEEIKISEYTEDNIIYGEYDYQKFCEMFF